METYAFKDKSTNTYVLAIYGPKGERSLTFGTLEDIQNTALRLSIKAIENKVPKELKSEYAALSEEEFKSLEWKIKKGQG